MAYDANRAAARAAAGQDVTTPRWTFEGLLRRLVDERTYPVLHRIAWSGDIGGDAAGFAEHEEFRFGAERILDGTQTLIDQTLLDQTLIDKTQVTQARQRPATQRRPATRRRPGSRRPPPPRPR